MSPRPLEWCACGCQQLREPPRPRPLEWCACGCQQLREPPRHALPSERLPTTQLPDARAQLRFFADVERLRGRKFVRDEANRVRRELGLR